MKTLELIRILLPDGSTIGKGQGLDDDGNLVTFALDHGPARDLLLALCEQNEDDDEPIIVEVESWQILSSSPAFQAIGAL